MEGFISAADSMGRVETTVGWTGIGRPGLVFGAQCAGRKLSTALFCSALLCSARMAEDRQWALGGIEICDNPITQWTRFKDSWRHVH